jgi:hypothetical protein
MTPDPTGSGGIIPLGVFDHRPPEGSGIYAQDIGNSRAAYYAELTTQQIAKMVIWAKRVPRVIVP